MVKTEGYVGWKTGAEQKKRMGTSGDRPVLKQQAMPVPAGIVPVCTMGMAREGTCRLEQMLPKREVATVPVR